MEERNIIQHKHKIMLLM